MSSISNSFSKNPNVWLDVANPQAKEKSSQNESQKSISNPHDQISTASKEKWYIRALKLTTIAVPLFYLGVNAYRSYSFPNQLFTGSQLFASGGTNSKKVEEINRALEKATPDLFDEIDNYRFWDKSGFFWDGETSSAMAFDFAARMQITCHQTKSIQDLRNCISEAAPYYRTSSETFRSRQKVFNAAKETAIMPAFRKPYLKMLLHTLFSPFYHGNDIEVMNQWLHERLQAIARFNGIELQPATPLSDIDINHPEKMEALINDISDLTPGTYVIRSIDLIEEDGAGIVTLMEGNGHTTILKIGDEDSISYYYDPSTGTEEIEKDRFKIFLKNKFEGLFKDEKLGKVRLYLANCQKDGCKNLSAVYSYNPFEILKNILFFRN